MATASLQGNTASLPWLAHYPAGVDWHADMKPTTLPALFDAAVERFGPKTCANFLGRTTSYADLGRQVTKTASGLQRAGVGRGTKVGLLLPNCPTFIVYYFAVLKIGGVIVNYNPALHGRRTRPSGQGQRHRADGHARPEAVVRQGRSAARPRRVAACRGRVVPGPAACAEVGAVQVVSRQGSGAPDRLEGRWPTAARWRAARQRRRLSAGR